MTNEQKQKRKDERLMKRAAECICTAFEIDRKQLVARDRHRNVADARMSLCALLTEKALRSDTIAAFIKRNRSNVAHSNRTISALEKRDKALTAKLERARRLLNAEDYTDRIANRIDKEFDGREGQQSVCIEYEYEKDGVVNCVWGDVTVYIDEYPDEWGSHKTLSIDAFDLTAHLVGDENAECDPNIAVDVDWLEDLIYREI